MKLTPEGHPGHFKTELRSYLVILSLTRSSQLAGAASAAQSKFVHPLLFRFVLVQSAGFQFEGVKVLKFDCCPPSF